MTEGFKKTKEAYAWLGEYSNRNYIFNKFIYPILGVLEIAVYGAIFYFLSYKYETWDLSDILLPLSILVGYRKRNVGVIVVLIFSLPILINYTHPVIFSSFIKGAISIGSFDFYLAIFLFSLFGMYIGSLFKESIFLNKKNSAYHHSFVVLMLVSLYIRIYTADGIPILSSFTIGGTYLLSFYVMYLAFSYQTNRAKIFSYLTLICILGSVFFHNPIMGEYFDIRYKLNNLVALITCFVFYNIGFELRKKFNGVSKDYSIGRAIASKLLLTL